MLRPVLDFIKEHHSHKKWVVQALDKLPKHFRPAIEQRYKERYRGSFKAANLMLLDTLDHVYQLGNARLNMAASEDELRAFAKERAREASLLVLRWKDADTLLREMRAMALRYGIKPPNKRNVTKTGQRQRLLCEKWWRRAVRCYVGRKVEASAIALGLVHRRQGLYVSNETLARRKGQRAKNRAMLESLTAVNLEGKEGQRNEYSLAELSDLGTSNPVIRRAELMTRAAGFDEIALAYGHAAEFYTITAPSRYHARLDKSGKENPKYEGFTPRETQAYLCKVFARIRSALDRRGLRMYGIRVAEPHHDGCPHWHMIVFFNTGWPKKLCGPVRPGEGKQYVFDERRAAVPRVRAIFRRYALAQDRGEAGALKHRFTAEAIDREKGSAAGYLAKYISKNIDGYGVGDDYEAAGIDNDATDSAKRVDAWAACWGVRQFQQFGGPPVTVWRELRRLDAEDQESEFMQAIVTAAKAGKWAMYVEMQGGVMVGRKGMSVSTYRIDGSGGVDIETGEIVAPRFNAYGEIAAPVTKGIQFRGEVIETRSGVWVFQRRGEAPGPRSSLNNCTGEKDAVHLHGVGALHNGAAVVGLGDLGSGNGQLDIPKIEKKFSTAVFAVVKEDLPGPWCAMPPDFWAKVDVGDDRGVHGFVRAG